MSQGPVPPPSGWNPYGQPVPSPHSSFDPTAPFVRPGQAPLGPSAPPPNTIQRFAPPPSRAPLFVGLAALVVVAALVLSMVLRGDPTPVPSPTTTIATPNPSPSSGMPFVTTTGVRGTWEITSTEWDAKGVLVGVRVSVDSGSFTYRFDAYTNAKAEPVDFGTPRKTPALTTGSVGEGQTVTGYLYLLIDRADATLILESIGGTGLSALPIKS